MTKMMEILESRQMFSATSVDATVVPAETSDPGGVVVSNPVDQSGPTLFKNCCTGAHYKTVTIEMRKAGGT